jgi:hypothetical protein
MRMVQAGNSLGLTLEALARLRIAGKMFRQDFDRNGPLQPRIAGFVDLAHASGADR